MLDFDYHKVRNFFFGENTPKVILVADAIKFTRSAPIRITHISEIDIFVTDRASLQPWPMPTAKAMSGSRAVEGAGSQHELPLD